MKLFAKGTQLRLDVDLLKIWEAVKIDLKLYYSQVTECQLFTGPPSPLSFTRAPLIPPNLHFRAHESLRNEL